jgi:hypothetical protein
MFDKPTIFQRRFSFEPLTTKRFYSNLFKCHAGMAELADAHGSGPCEGYFMEVRVLLPHHKVSEKGK